MSNSTLNPNLPRWMRHANGDLPNPTPQEVQADKESRTSRSEAEKDAEFEGIMDHYAKMAGYDSWEEQALNEKSTNLLEYLKTRDYSKAFPYATNGIALAFVGFYLLTFASIAGDGNHIYTVYRLFPVIASVAITAALWRLPDNSLMRVFYLMGLFTVSWLGA